MNSFLERPATSDQRAPHKRKSDTQIRRQGTGLESWVQNSWDEPAAQYACLL